MNQNKKKIQINQLIIHNLIEIIELYPKYTITQHISYISDKKDFFKWSNEMFLKEIEKYKDRLEEDSSEGDEEFFEEEL